MRISETRFSYPTSAFPCAAHGAWLLLPILLRQAVPNETSVAATTFSTTALSNREVLYDIKYASTEHLLCAEYILLDPTDTASYQKYGGLADFIRFLQAHGYMEKDRLGEQLLLFQKETRAETRVP